MIETFQEKASPVSKDNYWADDTYWAHGVCGSRAHTIKRSCDCSKCDNGWSTNHQPKTVAVVCIQCRVAEFA